MGNVKPVIDLTLSRDAVNVEEFVLLIRLSYCSFFRHLRSLTISDQRFPPIWTTFVFTT